MNRDRLKRELGYCGLFAERPTMKQAYEYVNDVAESFGKENAIYVITAAAVLQNTLVSQLVKDFVMIPREMAAEHKGLAPAINALEAEYLTRLEREEKEALTAKE